MNITLEQFSGPLDLLLKMIEEEKLDITEISLAKVADQYIVYIEQNAAIDPDEVADFLVIAARNDPISVVEMVMDRGLRVR